MSGDDIALRATLDASGVMTGLNQIKASVASTMSGLGGSFAKGEADFASAGQKMGAAFTQGLSAQFGALGGVVSQVTSALGPIGIAAAAAGVAITALGAQAVSLAANWQTMMASVSKTTGLEGSALDQFSAKLQEIRMNTGVAAEEISNMAVVAGSIGVPTDELAAFSEVAIKMGQAFGMSAESAANAMGQIGNVIKPVEMSWTEFGERAGSVVNVLADSMATSEEKILTGMMHISAVMARIKLPEASIPGMTALMATIQSLGMSADSAGEAIQDMLNYTLMNKGNAISDLLGISGGELQEKVRSDTVGLVEDVVKKISSLDVSKQSEALRLFGETGQKAIGLLQGDLDQTTGKFKMLGTAIENATSSWASGTSLDDAFKKSQATLDVAMDRMTQTFSVIGERIGTPLLPVISDIVNGFTSIVRAAADAGSAIAGIVVNSQAFQTTSEIISEIGATISTLGANTATVFEPLWDSIGGGAGVVAGLQKAFDALTAPINFVGEGILAVVKGFNSLETALAPVASTIGSTLLSAVEAVSSGLTTASAYAQAFGEAIGNWASQSATIQSIVSAVDSVKSALSGIVDWISDLGSKIASGLAEAIPKAITGFTSALDDLFSQGGEAASDAFTNAIKDSPLGGVFGFAEGISARANEILNVGKSSGDTMAEGVANSTDLENAPGDALSSTDALKAVGDAGSAAGEKYANQFQEQAALSGLNGAALVAMINSQDMPEEKIKETVFDLYGHAVKYWYDAAEKWPVTYLSIDDTTVASLQPEKQYVPWSLEDTLSYLGLPMPSDVEEAAKAAGDEGKAAILSVKESYNEALKGIFDFEPALKSLDEMAPKLEDRFALVMDNIKRMISEISSTYKETAEDWKADAQELVDAMQQSVSLENLATLQTAIEKNKSFLVDAYGDLGEDVMAAYKEKLAAGITDVDLYMKTEYNRIGESAAEALSDGFMSNEDKALFSSLETQLNILKEMMPEEFREIGGDSLLALINSINSGDADMAAAGASLGKTFGDSFKENLIGAASLAIPSLAEIIKNPSVAGDISDATKYAYNAALPTLKENANEMLKVLAAGTYSPEEIYTNYIANITELGDLVPSQVLGWISQVENGRMSLESFGNSVIALADAVDGGTVQLTNYGYALVKEADDTKTATTSQSNYNDCLLGTANATNSASTSQSNYNDCLLGTTSTLKGTGNVMESVGAQFGTLSSSINQNGETYTFLNGQVAGYNSYIPVTVSYNNTAAASYDSLTASVYNYGNALSYVNQVGYGTYLNGGQNSGMPVSYETLYPVANWNGQYNNTSGGQSVPVTVTNVSEMTSPYDAVTIKNGVSQWFDQMGLTAEDLVNITGPSGELWTKGYNIVETNTQNIPMDYLSANQEALASLNKEALLAYYNAQPSASLEPVGVHLEPDWIVEASNGIVTKVSEGLRGQIASTSQNTVTIPTTNVPSWVTSGLSVSEDTALVNDPRSDACIPFLDAPYLKTTDNFYLASGSMSLDVSDDVALLHDPRSDACIPFLDAPYLQTTDNWLIQNAGAMPLNDGAGLIRDSSTGTCVPVINSAINIDDLREQYVQGYISDVGLIRDSSTGACVPVINSAINIDDLREQYVQGYTNLAATTGTVGATAGKATIPVTTTSGNQIITGLSTNGYVIQYDPRQDTCEGLSFNAPEPSLKTTDPFYLGLTVGASGKNVATESYENYGWGGQVAQPLQTSLVTYGTYLDKQVDNGQEIGNLISSTAEQSATNFSETMSAATDSLRDAAALSYDTGLQIADRLEHAADYGYVQMVQGASQISDSAGYVIAAGQGLYDTSQLINTNSLNTSYTINTDSLNTSNTINTNGLNTSNTINTNGLNTSNTIVSDAKATSKEVNDKNHEWADYGNKSMHEGADYLVAGGVGLYNILYGANAQYTAGGYGSGGPTIVPATAFYSYPTYTNPNGVTVIGAVGPWGGTSVSGAGGWVGTGTTAGNAAFQGGSTPTWGGAAQSAALAASGSTGPVTIGSSGIQLATGGIVSEPTYGVFGEAGPEAFVPLYDINNGLKVLQDVFSYFSTNMNTILASGSVSQDYITQALLSILGDISKMLLPSSENTSVQTDSTKCKSPVVNVYCENNYSINVEEMSKDEILEILEKHDEESGKSIVKAISGAWD
mgnify:CR=1 FL=1